MSDDEYMLRAELVEANSEIFRHHRDFALISGIVHTTIIRDGDYKEAIEKIRNIVG